ncbi:MAG TPA: hypothetical protein VF830_04520 [Gemmatimonadales bacterium]
MAPSGDDHEISILDARLAEIDRRLHSIQAGLIEDERSGRPSRVAVPGDRPSPPRLVTAPPPGTPPPGEARSESELLARLRELTAAQERVLASMRQLLGGLEHVAGVPGRPESGSPAGQPVTISAGPFASTEALRAFRTALEGLPGVRSVELRGFEGADRAILEVHL